MTLKELMESHVSSVFLNLDEFAESVIRHVGGVQDALTDVTVTGLFIEVEANRDYASGDHITRTATLHIAEAVSVSDRDAWTVRGQRWDVNNGDYGQRVEAGMRFVALNRVEMVQTSKGQGRLI